MQSFQLPTVGGGLHKIRQSPTLMTATSYTLSYVHDLERLNYTVDRVPSSIFVVITLKFHHEQMVKDVLALIRKSGLYDKTTKIYLRFQEEPNRKIVNFCKLNYDKIEIHSSSNYNVMEFLEVRFKETGKYILCFDLTDLKREAIQELMMTHLIQEWRYCMQLLLERQEEIRSVGLFPSPFLSSDYWFHCFWIRSDPDVAFNTLSIEEKHPLLQCSKVDWFSSNGEVENSSFTYIKDEELEKSNNFLQSSLNNNPLSSGKKPNSTTYMSVPEELTKPSRQSKKIIPNVTTIERTTF